MDEIGFVIKSFIVSVFAVFCLQLKMGEVSVENRIVGYLHDALATKWMQDMGKGATHMTVTSYNKVIGDALKKANARDPSAVDEQLKAIKDGAEKHDQDMREIEDQ